MPRSTVVGPSFVMTPQLAFTIAVAVVVSCVVPLVGAIHLPHGLGVKKFPQPLRLDLVTEQFNMFRESNASNPPLAVTPAGLHMGEVEGCTGKEFDFELLFYEYSVESVRAYIEQHPMVYNQTNVHVRNIQVTDAAGTMPRGFENVHLPLMKDDTRVGPQGETQRRLLLTMIVSYMPQRGSNLDGSDTTPIRMTDIVRVLLPMRDIHLSVYADVLPNVHGVGPVTSTRNAEAVPIAPGQTVTYPLHVINPSRAQSITMRMVNRPVAAFDMVVADAAAFTTEEGRSMFTIPPFSRSMLLATFTMARVEPGVYYGHLSFTIEGGAVYNLWFNYSVIANRVPRLNMGVLRDAEQRLDYDVPFTNLSPNTPLLVTDAYILPNLQVATQRSDKHTFAEPVPLPPSHATPRRPHLFHGIEERIVDFDDPEPLPSAYARCLVVRPRFGSVAEAHKKIVAAQVTVLGPACRREIERALMQTDGGRGGLHGGARRISGKLAVRLNGTAMPHVPDRLYTYRFAVDLVFGDIKPVSPDVLFAPLFGSTNDGGESAIPLPKALRAELQDSLAPQERAWTPIDLELPYSPQSGALKLKLPRYSLQASTSAVKVKFAEDADRFREYARGGGRGDLASARDPQTEFAESVPKRGTRKYHRIAEAHIPPHAIQTQFDGKGEIAFVPLFPVGVRYDVGLPLHMSGTAQVTVATHLTIARLPACLIDVARDATAPDPTGKHFDGITLAGVRAMMGTSGGDHEGSSSTDEEPSAIAEAGVDNSVYAHRVMDPSMIWIPGFDPFDHPAPSDDPRVIAAVSNPDAAAKLLVQGVSLVHSVHLGVLRDDRTLDQLADKGSSSGGKKGGKGGKKKAVRPAAAPDEGAVSAGKKRRMLHLVNPYNTSVTLHALRFEDRVVLQNFRHGLCATVFSHKTKTFVSSMPELTHKKSVASASKIPQDAMPFFAKDPAYTAYKRVKKMALAAGESVTLVVEHLMPEKRKTVTNEYGTFEGRLSLDFVVEPPSDKPSRGSSSQRSVYLPLVIPTSFSLAPVDAGLRFEVASPPVTFPWSARTRGEHPVVMRNVTVTSTLPFDLYLTQAYAEFVASTAARSGTGGALAPRSDQYNSVLAGDAADDVVLHGAFEVDVVNPIVPQQSTVVVAKLIFHPTAAAAFRRSMEVEGDADLSREVEAVAVRDRAARAASLYDLDAFGNPRAGRPAVPTYGGVGVLYDAVAQTNALSSTIDPVVPSDARPTASSSTSNVISSYRSMALSLPEESSLRSESPYVVASRNAQPDVVISEEEIQEYEQRVAAAVQNEHSRLVLKSGDSSWTLPLLGECAVQRHILEAHVVKAIVSATSNEPTFEKQSNAELHTTEVETTVSFGVQKLRPTMSSSPSSTRARDTAAGRRSRSSGGSSRPAAADALPGDELENGAVGRMLIVVNPTSVPLLVQPVMLAHALDDGRTPLTRDHRRRLMRAGVRFARQLRRSSSSTGAPKKSSAADGDASFEDSSELSVAAADAWAAPNPDFYVARAARQPKLLRPGEAVGIGPFFVAGDACARSAVATGSNPQTISAVVLLRNNNTGLEPVRLQVTCGGDPLTLTAAAKDAQPRSDGRIEAVVTTDEVNRWIRGRLPSVADGAAFPQASQVVRHLFTLGSALPDGQPRGTLSELLSARLVADHYRGGGAIAPELATPLNAWLALAPPEFEARLRLRNPSSATIIITGFSINGVSCTKTSGSAFAAPSESVPASGGLVRVWPCIDGTNASAPTITISAQDDEYALLKAVGSAGVAAPKAVQLAGGASALIAVTLRSDFTASDVSFSLTVFHRYHARDIGDSGARDVASVTFPAWVTVPAEAADALRHTTPPTAGEALRWYGMTLVLAPLVSLILTVFVFRAVQSRREAAAVAARRARASREQQNAAHGRGGAATRETSPLPKGISSAPAKTTAAAAASLLPPSSTGGGAQTASPTTDEKPPSKKGDRAPATDSSSREAADATTSPTSSRSANGGKPSSKVTSPTTASPPATSSPQAAAATAAAVEEPPVSSTADDASKTAAATTQKSTGEGKPTSTAAAAEEPSTATGSHAKVEAPSSAPQAKDAGASTAGATKTSGAQDGGKKATTPEALSPAAASVPAGKKDKDKTAAAVADTAAASSKKVNQQQQPPAQQSPAQSQPPTAATAGPKKTPKAESVATPKDAAARGKKSVADVLQAPLSRKPTQQPASGTASSSSAGPSPSGASASEMPLPRSQRSGTTTAAPDPPQQLQPQPQPAVKGTKQQQSVSDKQHATSRGGGAAAGSTKGGTPAQPKFQQQQQPKRAAPTVAAAGPKTPPPPPPPEDPLHPVSTPQAVMFNDRVANLNTSGSSPHHTSPPRSTPGLNPSAQPFAVTGDTPPLSSPAHQSPHKALGGSSLTTTPSSAAARPAAKATAYDLGAAAAAPLAGSAGAAAAGAGNNNMSDVERLLASLHGGSSTTTAAAAPAGTAGNRRPSPPADDGGWRVTSGSAPTASPVAAMPVVPAQSVHGSAHGGQPQSAAPVSHTSSSGAFASPIGPPTSAARGDDFGFGTAAAANPQQGQQQHNGPAAAAGGQGAIDFNFGGLPAAGQTGFLDGIFRGTALSLFEDDEA